VTNDEQNENKTGVHRGIQARSGGAHNRAGLQDCTSGGGLDIGANLLGRWKHQFEAQATGVRLGADEREELKRLHKEVRQLRLEKEILKKASQYFAKEMQ
jgi:transposase